MRSRLPGILALGLAILAFGFFLLSTGYPWQLALLAATAIGALFYSTLTTGQRMRRLHQPPNASDLGIGRLGLDETSLEQESSAKLAPGEDSQSKP